ncbi:hypothetical protein [Nocardioides sp. WS12]|uniref:hypothetical protein n=1 Tax=Nocardioides sp. WS12 TaxID=2486272 RepID=UPI0015F8EC89|nr:hypothetical protein [Nocardioides sp. WS12]
MLPAAAVKVTDPDTADTQPLPAASAATGSPIKIGFPYTDWQALKEAGFPVDFRDDDAEQIDALVAWANAHGGLGGHVIEPVKVKVTTVDPNSPQAACLKLTQEQKVFAVVDVSVYRSRPTCVTKQNDTLMLSAYPGAGVDYLDQFPNMMAGIADLEQQAGDMIGGGAEMGFFEIPGKLGILRNGCDPDEVWDGANGVYALLDEMGISDGDYVEYRDACDRGVTSGATAAQALLGFKAANVTKIIAGTGGLLEKTVSAQGQKQGFEPAWLIGDFSATIQNSNLLNNDNIDGAYGVSGTVLDYADSPGADLCSEIFAAKGLPALKSIDVDVNAGFRCDAVVQLVQIGALMGADATPATYAAAAQKAGNLFTAQTFGVTYGEGDLLGAEKVALFRYDSGRQEWAMQGEPITAPHIPQD